MLYSTQASPAGITELYVDGGRRPVAEQGTLCFAVNNADNLRLESNRCRARGCLSNGLDSATEDCVIHGSSRYLAYHEAYLSKYMCRYPTYHTWP